MVENLKYNKETQSLHSGVNQSIDSLQYPVVGSTAFKFADSKTAADLFALQAVGNIYSRLTNPTVDALSGKLAGLHNAVGAFCTSSGHAAQFLAFANLLTPGDHIVASKYLYGGSITQLTYTFPLQFNWQSTLVDITNLQEIEQAITPKTKAIFLESQSNPHGVVADIKAISTLANQYGIPVIVDNTFPTPYFLNPIEHGATIVTYSLSKYITGNSTIIGGAVVDSGAFDWGQNDKFKLLTQVETSYELSFFETFKNMAFTLRGIAVGLRDFGTTLSPFAAVEALKGLDTLHVRMQRHYENAIKVARYLETNPAIGKVNYSFLDNHITNKQAKNILPNGGSSVFTVALKQGYEAAKSLVDNVNIFLHSAQVGDAHSLIIHPASTTHSQLTDDQKTKAGIANNVVRLSIGLENADDLIADLDQALAK